MLRDLDRREAAAGARQPVAPVVVPPNPATGRRRIIFGLLAVLAVLPVAAYYQPQLARVLPAITGQTTHQPIGQPVRQTRETLRRNSPADGRAEPVEGVAADPVSGSGSIPLSKPPQARLTEMVVVSAEHGGAVQSSVESRETGKQPFMDGVQQTPRPGEEYPEPEQAETAPPPNLTRVKTEPARVREETPPARPERRPQTVAGNSGDKRQTPKATVADVRQVSVRRVAPKQVRQSAADVYATARVHLDGGQLQEAEAALRHSLTLDAAHTGARQLLVMLMLKSGERRQAVALLDAGIAIAPDSVPLNTLRARLLIDEGDLAGRLLERPPLLSATDIELLSLLGSAYQQTRRFSDALGIYRRITALQPDNPRALAGLAISLDATGDPDQALTVYRQALALNGLPAEVREYARQRVSALSGGR
jgi:Flp pilus assembly protein TadD